MLRLSSAIARDAYNNLRHLIGGIPNDLCPLG